LNEVINNNQVNRPIPLKERRGNNFIRQASDNLNVNAEQKLDMKKPEEPKHDIEGSVISNTSSIRMIVPPYQSPPDANGRKPSLKKSKFPIFLQRNVSEL
jgi:hypothetical protein